MWQTNGLRAPPALFPGVGAQTVEALSDKPSLSYVLGLLQFDGLWFIGRHECWVRDWDFGMRVHTDLLLTNTISGCSIVEGLALPPHNRLAMYGPVLD